MLERLSAHLQLLQYAHVLWGFALFVGLALWAYWPSRKSEMQRHATLILSDDNSSERGRHDA